MTITEFLLARIADDEEVAQAAFPQPTGRWSWRTVPDLSSMETRHIARYDPARVLAECEAKRRIVELHESWPVLVEREPTLDLADTGDLSAVAYRASQQIAWLTEQEYRTRFGDEPPTAPMIAALAAVYADHPDYREEWRP